MLEILYIIFGLTAFVLAAHRRKSRRSRGTWRQVPIDFTLSLGTLADNDMISGTLTNNAIDSLRAMSLHGTWTLEGATASEGPITVGVAHGDYSAAEMEEWYEAIGSMNRSDKIAAEQAQRLCRRVVTFGALQTGAEVTNDGKPIKTRLNWLISPGLNIAAWAHNDSGGALTTGAVVHFQGILNILFVD